MSCTGKHSGLTIDKCFHFGGYTGHRSAKGVDARTYRTYTGPRSALTALRRRAGALLAYNEADVAQRDRYWKKLKLYGVSGNRVKPRDVWGRSKREHKENAARYLGFFYRAKAAKAAYNHQQLINNAMGAGAGVSSTPITSPTRKVFSSRADLGPRVSGALDERRDALPQEDFRDVREEAGEAADAYEETDRIACEDAGMQWLAGTRECVAFDVTDEEEEMVPEDELPQVTDQEEADLADEDLEAVDPLGLLPAFYTRYRTPIWLVTLGVTGYFIYRFYERK